MVLFLVLDIAIASLLGTCSAASNLPWELVDIDLTHFATRPEIKVPVLNVTKHRPSEIEAGFWFLAPYARVVSERHPVHYYQPCQTGPVIYDEEGKQLVWSGACEAQNRAVFDFRYYEFSNTTYMSVIFTAAPSLGDADGHGVVLNNAYEEIRALHMPPATSGMNMHEFNLKENGETALYILSRPRLVDITSLHLPAQAKSIWAADMGFQEKSLITGETIFEWWALDEGHGALTRAPGRSILLTKHRGHANAVDKNEQGDYLFNSRYTNTIYKISGADGHIIWHLGGKQSSFRLLHGLNFSRQHDARFLGSNGSKETIYFLDNGDDGEGYRSAQTSGAVIVELIHSTMEAQVRQRILRLDGGRTKLRGNHQVLANGNHVVCWSENGLMSEHNAAGDIIQETRFLSHRFVTYRGYRYHNFVGWPAGKPVVKSLAYGASPQSSTTVTYVSWNGATEVAFWVFRAHDSGQVIARERKTGFETSVQLQGLYTVVVVQALDANGELLGSSDPESTEMHRGWARPRSWSRGGTGWAQCRQHARYNGSASS